MPKIDKNIRADIIYMVNLALDRVDELEQENKYLEDKNGELETGNAGMENKINDLIDDNVRLNKELSNIEQEFKQELESIRIKALRAVNEEVAVSSDLYPVE